VPAGFPLLQPRRHLEPSDQEAVRILLDAVAARTHHVPLNDAARASFEAGGGDCFLAVLTSERPRGAITAYGQLAGAPGGDLLAALVLHPLLREDRTAVGSLVLRRLLAEAPAHPPGSVTLWLFQPDADDDAMAASCGLRPDREVSQLRCSLPLPEPVPPIPVRAFVPGQDEDAWLALNARAFAGHPDQGSWDRTTLAERMAQPWFEPRDLLLCERDGRLVASCWTKVHRQERPPTGEIYVIGVDPELQGQGLGRAMTVAGLDHLARQGLTRAMLYVDATNVPAVALYRSLGFHQDHLDRAYVGELPPGRPAPSHILG
jgi:mycothiol synthase